MSKLNGKVAVVTGASKGIGAAIAKALAAEGASVVVNYASSKAGAEAVVGAIKAAGGKAIAVGGDVATRAGAQGVIDAAVEHYGRLDVLVNNSGVYEFVPIEDISEDHFHRQLHHGDDVRADRVHRGTVRAGAERDGGGRRRIVAGRRESDCSDDGL